MVGEYSIGRQTPSVGLEGDKGYHIDERLCRGSDVPPRSALSSFDCAHR
jgi:hypothetical protein